MARLNQLASDTASVSTQKLFTGIENKLGKVPNMMRAMGNSPAALGAYLQFSGQLSAGKLTSKQGELIALAVGQANQCDYCLAAHSTLGKMAGLSPEQISDARRGEAIDGTDNALVTFAVKLVQQHGHATDADLHELREHGFDDGLIAGDCCPCGAQHFYKLLQPRRRP